LTERWRNQLLGVGQARRQQEQGGGRSHQRGKRRAQQQCESRQPTNWGEAAKARSRAIN
jgi:hypothetical protein